MCGLSDDPLLTLHPAQRALGHDARQRGEAYRLLLSEAVNEDELVAIRTYLQQQRALGYDEFKAMVEAKTRRFAGTRVAHRPTRRTASGGK